MLALGPLTVRPDRFRLGSEYRIDPPVAGWQPHFQFRTLDAYRPSVRGTFRYAEPFDRV